MQTLIEWIIIATLLMASYLLRVMAGLCWAADIAVRYLEIRIPIWIDSGRRAAARIRMRWCLGWQFRHQLLLEQKDRVYDLEHTY